MNGAELKQRLAAIVAAIAPQVEDAEIAKARRVRPGVLGAHEIAVLSFAIAAEV